MRCLFLASSALFLTGCATTSFAPPNVNVHQAMTRGSLADDCRLTNTAGDNIDPDVYGALTLVANYLYAYRCTMRIAANGRQVFELPSFVSLVGSTTAVALGAGTDVAILGGAGNSVFTAGNKYYAPQEQTSILSDAIDALACIQSEAVGVDTFTIEATSDEQKKVNFARGGGTVEVPVERVYFNMVASALVNVERAAAQRLARRGSFDAAGIAAEIEKLIKDIEEAKKQQQKPPPDEGPPGVRADLAKHVKMVQLDLNVLQPELQKCVVRSKG